MAREEAVLELELMLPRDKRGDGGGEFSFARLFTCLRLEARVERMGVGGESDLAGDVHDCTVISLGLGARVGFELLLLPPVIGIVCAGTE